MIELMIQLQRGGLWYHVNAEALVIHGHRWDCKDQEWVKHTTTPYAEQTIQQKTIGQVPRLVPQT